MARDAFPAAPARTPHVPHGAVVELGTDIQKWIADRLIEMFDEVVQQGVPDRFVELLQLESSKNLGFFDGGWANHVRRNGKKKIKAVAGARLHVPAPRPSNLR
jgi:hypothetical protein